MKNITRHYGKLEIIRRENNSVNGNPRYYLHIGGVHCYTAPDSSLAYELPNYAGKQVTATVGTYYRRATLNSIESAE
jgi:hypothetical protein